MPYTALKQVIRFANPAAVMGGVLDLFLAQPFGARSLAQRVFGLALNDGIKQFQKSIDALIIKINDPILCEKLKSFCNANEEMKNEIRSEAVAEDVDLVVAILRSERIDPELTPEQIGLVFNAFVAWNNAVENVRQLSDPIPNPQLTTPDRRLHESRRPTLRLPQTAPKNVHPPTRQIPNASRNRRTRNPPPLPRPLHNLLRTPRPRLQIRKRLQLRHRLRLLRRRHLLRPNLRPTPRLLR